MIKVKLDGLKVRVPKHGLDFLFQMAASNFIECDHKRAQQFFQQFGQRDNSVNAELFYKAAREMLIKAKRVMDSLGVRFWLSSGTCLGEHFQPYMLIIMW
jgi:fukutin